MIDYQIKYDIKDDIVSALIKNNLKILNGLMVQLAYLKDKRYEVDPDSDMFKKINSAIKITNKQIRNIRSSMDQYKLALLDRTLEEVLDDF